MIPCGKFGLPYLGKAAAAARAALPISTSVRTIFVCPNGVQNGTQPAFGIFLNVYIDAEACDCTQGLYGHRKRVCTKT